MNFLAHCALGGADAGLIVGGFLGDFVKGLIPTDLPTDVQRGIRLHRRVDAYSNGQPELKQSVGRFPPELRRIAPVFVDLIADHFLALTFERHFGGSLAQFSQRTYAALDAYSDVLTAPARSFRRYAEETAMFERYRKTDTVLRGFERVAARLALGMGVATAGARAFEAEYAPLSADFERYFPDIQRHARAWIDTHPAQR